MIYVFTGNGKGKTSAAVGMGIRAVGAGENVLMMQFFKPGNSSEIKVIKKIKYFDIKSFGRPGFGPYSARDANLVQQGLEFFKTAAQKRKYNLVILDEINVAVKFGLVGVKEVLALIKKYGRRLDIVLTGRYCPKEIIQIADLVTEFKEKKHYFKKGIKARKGIEY